MARAEQTPESTAFATGARPLGLDPRKVVAVHLNYGSRASERGRTPAFPSYFLKPPSSLAGDGATVVRPRGCELLCYEGEIALVIGRHARNVSIDAALDHVASYTAANDFGVYDLRHADRGSNVLAKGHDGFTPVGPRLVPADAVDPDSLVVRTLVNGEVVQEDTTANLLFSFAHLVADLSRFMTLEPGDVVLTGTPANSRPVEPGDLVEVEVEGIGRLRSRIVEADEDLDPIGAMPSVDAGTRAAAFGATPSAAPLVEPETLAALTHVSTATLTTQLRLRGIRTTFLEGLRPTRPDLRMVGTAFTLRYVPVREDIVEARKGEPNAQRRAVESIGPGEVLVIEARGERGAGTMGDILALRARRRGAAGIVTDGGLRDTPAFAELDVPTYYQVPHASVLGRVHYPLETNVPVTCGGVLVLPGDVIVGDAEGVVVVPAALAAEVAHDAVEQELAERFALERVDEGESTTGLYPLSEERRPEFEAWREAQAHLEATSP